VECGTSSRRPGERRHHATPIRTRKISHVLLHVSDIERSVKFYTDILGSRSPTAITWACFPPQRHGSPHFGLVPGPATGVAQGQVPDVSPHGARGGHVDDLFKRVNSSLNTDRFVFEGRRGRAAT